jgi:hypothetical protein
VDLVDVGTIEGGSSILFLGAGFSADATNVADKDIKDVAGLISYLLGEVGIRSADGYDLDSAAEEYQLKKGDKATAAALHSNFRSKSVTSDQRLIVTQPWYRIYTTNYDDVIERICTEEHKPITTKEIDDPVEPPLQGTTQLIHIYGNITRASEAEFKSKFLLTERQRDNSPFFTSGWMRRFHDDVLAASSVVFLGFSLTDIDIRRLLGSLPQEIFSKIHFIARPSTKSPVINRMSRFGTAHPIGIDAFAAHLLTKRPGMPVKRFIEIPPALREVAYRPQVDAHVSSKDIDNLILSGDIAVDKLSEADLSGNSSSYTIQRSVQSYARAYHNSSSNRPILIHGDIGNGKTIFAHQVGYQFSQQGYRVFQVQREPENIGDVLAFLQSSTEKTLIIFDDLMHFKSLPSAILRMNHDNLVVLSTVRTIVLETSSERIRRSLNDATPIEIDLNTPLRPETLGWIKYLDTNGLWGEQADLAEREKLGLIENKCGGQLRDLVLSLYETGSLHRRVEELLLNIQSLETRSRNLIGLSALLSYADLEQSSQFLVLSDLVGYNGALEDLRSSLNEKELGSLIRLNTVDVVVRSPALSQFILSRTFSLGSLLSIVEYALKRLDKYYVDDEEFLNLGRGLLKFSLYGRLVNAKHENALIEKFYDDCRTLSFASKDPLFWVQRSICNMHDKQFDVSYRFVETAYSLARKRPGFDPYQIENHHARLMLTESRERGVSADGARELQAMSLLKGVLDRKSDDLYHPLSVMRLFADITEKHRSGFSSIQKTSMKSALDQSIKSIKSFKRTDRFRSLLDLRRRLVSASKSLT